MESKYFTVEELSCRCGCGLMNINQSSLTRLDKAREEAGVAFNIGKNNRACTCAEHNKNIGASDTSSHVADEFDKKSFAFDIEARDSVTRSKIVSGLIKAGFTRIGIASTFVHADDDPAKASNVMWLY